MSLSDISAAQVKLTSSLYPQIMMSVSSAGVSVSPTGPGIPTMAGATGPAGSLSGLPGHGVGGVGGGGGGGGPGGKCCDAGRPIMTDPHTGQTVCSCQYNPALQLAMSYPRVGSLAEGVYANPYATAAAAMQSMIPSPGADPSTFYSAMGLQAAGYYPYDMAGYPYNGFAMDPNARRKNATRESTQTLKAWLSEHRKNPYPTKGEKIMLAIITKMTLTQVSTWFANARRRLKKENKMTWSPRNRCGEDGEEEEDEDEDDKENDDEDATLHTSNSSSSSSSTTTNNNNRRAPNDDNNNKGDTSRTEDFSRSDAEDMDHGQHRRPSHVDNNAEDSLVDIDVEEEDDDDDDLDMESQEFNHLGNSDKVLMAADRLRARCDPQALEKRSAGVHPFVISAASPDTFARVSHSSPLSNSPNADTLGSGRTDSRAEASTPDSHSSQLPNGGQKGCTPVSHHQSSNSHRDQKGCTPLNHRDRGTAHSVCNTTGTVLGLGSFGSHGKSTTSPQQQNKPKIWSVADVVSSSSSSSTTASVSRLEANGSSRDRLERLTPPSPLHAHARHPALPHPAFPSAQNALGGLAGVSRPPALWSHAVVSSASLGGYPYPSALVSGSQPLFAASALGAGGRPGGAHPGMLPRMDAAALAPTSMVFAATDLRKPQVAHERSVSLARSSLTDIGLRPNGVSTHGFPSFGESVPTAFKPVTKSKLHESVNLKA